MFPSVNKIKVLTGSWRPSSLTAALGTIQTMVGVINVGLGPGRSSTRPKDLTSIGALYWLGAVFIITGIMSIVTGQGPSPCLMSFSMIMNIIAAIFAIIGIALYSVDITHASLLWMCDRTERESDDCQKVAFVAQRLLTTVDVLLIVLGILLLCVSICFVVRGFKARKSSMKDVEDGQNIEKRQIGEEKLQLSF